MDRMNLNWIYMGSDGNPRNFKPPEITTEQSPIYQLRAGLEADVDALKATQRYVAVGIIAVGTTIASAINPPSNAGDFLGNMFVPIAVQTLNYISFRKGIHLMRGRAIERRLAGEQGEQ